MPLVDIHVAKADSVVTFSDSNLEQTIREAINKSSGDIYQSDLAGLTSLNGSNRNIQNLSGIENCLNLTELTLRSNQISDISALSDLTNLQYLYLASNQISDISALSGRTNLQNLELGSNQISDISALSGLTNLQYLDLDHNRVSDISALADLTNLQNLGLDSNQISDISPLSGLTNLQGLGLWGSQVSDISPLSGLTKLTLLNLWGNQVSNISALSGLTKLSILWLGENRVSDIHSLSSLTNLTLLDVGGNSINDISPLAGLTNLTQLRLWSDPISDLSPLSGLTNLQFLYMGNNQISNISALSGLTNLQQLDLHINHISNIQPLIDNSGLSSGDMVNLSDNPLNVTSINTYIPQLQARGVSVYYNASSPTPTPTLATTPTLIPTHTPIPADSGNGLVAYYPFNGNANDESGNGHDGTVHGATLTKDRLGNANSAYSFDGISSYIQIPYSDDFYINTVTGFTVSVWFKAQLTQSSIFDIMDKSHGDNGVVDDRTGWVIQSGSATGQVGFDVGTGSGWYGLGTNNSVLDNQWHQLAITYSRTDMKLYLDGVLVNSGSFSQSPSSNTRDLFIGKHYALGRYFNGSIDDIRIYDRALSASEISALFNSYNASPYQTDFAKAVPLASQISTNPKVIGTNVALALALVLLFYLAATLFNSTIRENYEVIRGWFQSIRNWFRRVLRLPDKSNGKPEAKNKSREYLVGVVTVLATALIYCFIDPYFTHGLTFLALFISLAVAIGIVTFFYEGMQTILLKHGSGVPAVFRIRPIAIVIAVTFVIISRVFHFHPGLTFGFVGACVPLAFKKEPKYHQRAKPILIGALFIAAISIIAFGLRTPVHDALANNTNFGLSLLEMILVAVFVLGLEGLVFTLLPLMFMDGYWIFRWKWWVWFIVSSIVVFLFFHIIINQNGDIVKAVSDANTQMIIWLTGICVVLSIVVWLFFAIRKKREK